MIDLAQIVIIEGLPVRCGQLFFRMGPAVWCALGALMTGGRHALGTGQIAAAGSAALPCLRIVEPDRAVGTDGNAGVSDG